MLLYHLHHRHLCLHDTFDITGIDGVMCGWIYLVCILLYGAPSLSLSEAGSECRRISQCAAFPGPALLKWYVTLCSYIVITSMMLSIIIILFLLFLYFLT